jgi:hypothetical protein
MNLALYTLSAVLDHEPQLYDYLGDAGYGNRIGFR